MFAGLRSRWITLASCAASSASTICFAIGSASFEAGEDLRLPLEPGEAIRILGERFGEDLQCDLAVQLRVSGLPDLPHTALAEEGGHPVVPEARTGAE